MASHEVGQPRWPRCGPRLCPWPGMDRSPLCGEVRVCVWAAHRPPSVCRVHIDLGFCLCPSWPGQLGCPAVSVGLSPPPPLPPPSSLPWVPHLPCHPLSLRGSESSDLETEAPPSFSLFLSSLSLSFLPLSSPPPAPSLPLSLLLPNASWLRLNISPPRFLAPALGAFTKRRASSPLPCPPSSPPPPLLRSPSESGSGRV